MRAALGPRRYKELRKEFEKYDRSGKGLLAEEDVPRRSKRSVCARQKARYAVGCADSMIRRAQVPVARSELSTASRVDPAHCKPTKRRLPQRDFKPSSRLSARVF